MNLIARRFAAVFLVTAALSACGKKQAETADNAAAPSASEEQPGVATPTEDAVATTTTTEDVPAPAPPTDPAVADVPAELLASDRAYEAWFQKYHLDLNDPKMLDADPDGDGATNRDEFMADTNPNDPSARPGVHKVIRLKEYSEVRVPLVLQSVEGQKANIRHADGEKAESVVVGGTIGGMKVEKVMARREVDKNGEAVDLSRVELSDPATKQKVVLVKDLVAKSNATSAVLTADDGTMMKVKQGEVFTWPSEKGATYKVIDLRADQVVVQEVVSKRMWTISKQ